MATSRPAMFDYQGVVKPSLLGGSGTVRIILSYSYGPSYTSYKY